MNPLNHVAIIMDGNGRWGLKHKNSRNEGHRAGLDTIENILNETIIQKIKFITLFTFSTENWSRPQKEIKYLFKLLENFLLNKIEDLNKKNIRLKIIGNKNFSPILNKLLESSENLTANNTKLQINLALNYGSKVELVETFKKLKKYKKKFTEANVSKNLFTNGIPDPDLLIRTGNTKRLSNFLLWQMAYTEIYFVKKLWPEFKVIDYKKIIKEFKSIKRTFGNLK
jgi:undecaprenyl diphosphate synthase